MPLLPPADISPLSAMVLVAQTRTLMSASAAKDDTIPRQLGCRKFKSFDESDGMQPGQEISYFNKGCGATLSQPNPPRVEIVRSIQDGTSTNTLRYVYDFPSEGPSVRDVARAFKADWHYLPPRIMTDGAGFSTPVEFSIPGNGTRLGASIDGKTSHVIILELSQTR